MSNTQPRMIVDKVADGTTVFVRQWKSMGPEERQERFMPDTRMCPAVVGDNDIATHNKRCPHCRQGFRSGQVILESIDQVVQIHATCVVEMYQRLPTTPEAIEAEYERTERELITGLELHDE